MKTLTQRKGFTLAELLVVLAVIAILVAIAIPVFSASREKAAQAVDMANARAIQGQLATMVISGQIQPPSTINDEDPYGVWVVVWAEGKAPQAYKGKNGTAFFGSQNGVSINGTPHTANWDVQDEPLKAALAACFTDGSITVHSGGPEKGGWDWYLVQYTFRKNGEPTWRIMSGNDNGACDGTKGTPGETAIEQMMGITK